MVAGVQMVRAQKAMKIWYDGKYELYFVNNVDSVQFVSLVSDIYLSEETIQMEVGETKQLTATIYPIDADVRTVTWESSNPSVAFIANNTLLVGISKGVSTITCSATDGSGVKADCLVTVGYSDDDNYEYVDLGLPSGTLWATRNIGAVNPWNYGYYFAWAETKQNGEYNWSAYKYCNGTSDTLLKYCKNSSYGVVDNKTELDPEDDAATVNWGSNWQMPSEEQLAELRYGGNTTTTWTTLNGFQGWKIASKRKEGWIFLPAAGRYYSGIRINEGSEGLYWSRTLNENSSEKSCYLEFDSSFGTTQSGMLRCCGLTVRPVRKQ